jgi:hypothetical protein
LVRTYVIASPSVSRPSASVLLISTVVPSIDVSTSPSLYARPETRFSQHAATACTSCSHPSVAIASIAEMTAAAPDMSTFMSSIAFDGLSE